MNFEEQFPSLYNQGWQTLNQIIPFTRWMDKDCKVMVQRHCLDRARVEKIIDELKVSNMINADELKRKLKG